MCLLESFLPAIAILILSDLCVQSLEVDDVNVHVKKAASAAYGVLNPE